MLTRVGCGTTPAALLLSGRGRRRSRRRYDARVLCLSMPRFGLAYRIRRIRRGVTGCIPKMGVRMGVGDVLAMMGHPPIQV